MHLLSYFVSSLLLRSVAAASLVSRQDTSVDPLQEIAAFQSTDALAQLAAQGLDEVKEFESSGIASRSTTCSLRNAIIRRDWYES